MRVLVIFKHYKMIVVDTQYCDDNVLASAIILTRNKNETKIKSNPMLILRFLH